MVIWEHSVSQPARQSVGGSMGRAGWTNRLSHWTWISVADWQLASDLVLVCDPLEWSLSKLYVCAAWYICDLVGSALLCSALLCSALLWCGPLEPRLARKVALTNSNAAHCQQLSQPTSHQAAGSRQAAGSQQLQLIALYNVRFPVDITRFAAATLSKPSHGQ